MRYKNLRDGFEQVDVAVISRTFPRDSIRLALSEHGKKLVESVIYLVRF